MADKNTAGETQDKYDSRAEVGSETFDCSQIPVSDDHLELLKLLSGRVVNDVTEIASGLDLATEAQTGPRKAVEKGEASAEISGLKFLQILSDRAISDAKELDLRLKSATVVALDEQAEAEVFKLRKNAKAQARDIIIQARREAESQTEQEFLRIMQKAQNDADLIRENAEKLSKEIISEAQKEAQLKAKEEASRVRRETEASADDEALNITKKACEESQQIKEDALRQGQKIVSKLRMESESELEELTSRIKRKAESEADNLIEEARKQAREIISSARIESEEEARGKSADIIQQARQMAIEIEAEAVNRVTQEKRQVMEAIDTYMADKAANAKSATDDERRREHIAGEAEFGEETLTDCISQIEELLESEPVSAEGMADASPSALNNDGDADGSEDVSYEALQQMEALAIDDLSSPVPEEELSELFDGEVEVAMAPPINIARLLSVTRYLEKNPDIKILQTAGSWSTGSIVTIFLDTPLPFIDLLKAIPNVENAVLLEEGDKSSWSSAMKSLISASSNSGCKKIVITVSGVDRKQSAQKETQQAKIVTES